MKLLRNDEIQSLRNEERRTEIVQGHRLAKQVDDLRTKKSEEEAALEKFKTETTLKTLEEIKSLTGARDTLVSEVRSLERKREELKAPLDQEWKEVRALKSETIKTHSMLNEKYVEVIALEESVTSRESEVEKRKKEVDSNIAYLREIKKETEAAIALQKADRRSLELERAEFERHSGSESAKLEAREKSALRAEERNAETRKRQDDRELELNRRETLINDRTLALERNIKRKK